MDNIADNIGNSLGYIMVNVSWQMKETLRKLFLAKGYDVTSDQFAVLLRLWQQDGISQLELCQKTCKNKSNLTRILDSMEKRGLLFRQLSKQDRRSYNICLTEKGAGLKDGMISIALEFQTSILNGINKEEEKVLLKVLDNIKQNLDNINK